MYTIELFINDGNTPKWHRLNTEWETKEEATKVANVLIENVKDLKHDIVVYSNGDVHGTNFKVVGIKYRVWGSDIVDIRLANVAPKIEIKKDSWHYKLTKLITPKDSMPKSICGYFWNLVGRGLFSALFISCISLVFANIGGTVLIHILASFGITLGTGLTIGAYILGAILFAVLGALVFLIVVGGVWLFADFLPRKMAQRRLKKRLEHQTNIQKDLEVREKSLSDEIHESFKNKHCNFIEFK
ncbi:hypothetical protein [Proteus phage PM2]|uniref:Uncharacterized protein n=1 Tax=Proteus phage PM2 TaxID=2025809 RepID=A0A249XWP0_9CAUD|nr:membrane protein [Proteus phage PM2]ASZ76342.1 hypothetical protein [Proteus phage PM2]